MATISMELVGGERLERALKALGDKTGPRIVRRALRASAKRLNRVIVQSFSGIPVKPQTGRLLLAMAGERVKVRIKKELGVPALIQATITMPTREELSIPSGATGFYPYSLEYGYTRTRRNPVTVAALRPIRDAVNARQSQELSQIGTEIGRGIERAWSRMGKAGA